VVLVTGDEEYLLTRAIEQITAAVRAGEPSVVVTERLGGQLAPGELADLLSPSLFAEAGVIVIRAAQDVVVAELPFIEAFLADPTPELTLVLQHAGGAKGKALLTAARRAAGHVIDCPRLTRAEERADFVRGEARRAGATISADAVAHLLDAVGSDLRELATVTGQLAADSGGAIDARTVAAYHRGRAEVSGFAVADRAVVADVPGAMETLRWARSIGVAQVLIADALADGVRTIARVSAAGAGSPNALAAQLGMPPWKVRRAQSQARGWSEDGLARALGVVAALNADVKGNAASPDFALEQAIWALARCRRAGSAQR
jgi:DNA polymerase-3 subunit delta